MYLTSIILSQLIKCMLSKCISQCQVLERTHMRKKHQKIEFYLSKFPTRDHPKKYPFVNVTMFHQPDRICRLLTVHPLSLTITLFYVTIFVYVILCVSNHKVMVLSMSHSHRIPKLCQEDSFLR